MRPSLLEPDSPLAFANLVFSEVEQLILTLLVVLGYTGGPPGRRYLASTLTVRNSCSGESR